MKTLVTGGDGLLAHQLKKIAPRNFELLFAGHAEFDLANPGLMAQRLAEWHPQTIINTAAYNLVDRCEIERDLSWLVNATAPETLAKLCAEKNIRLVHYSTDYVFDGKKKLPYAETDTANPLNHYAAGKFAGEQAVLRASPKNLVLRTSWVFDWHPTQTKTFVHTVLKSAREGRAFKSTTDQVSVPTFATDLAQWTLDLLRAGAGGLFHAVNDEGVSRFDWAKIILDEAVRTGLISSAPAVEPVLSSFFSTTMRRPDYTVMSNEKLSRQLGRPLGSWRAGLRKMLAQMK
ncbi:MAG TPA: dTDP-4-dehydrorhamnose reductase [Candidatus Saccharimonadales bacterium]|nr:dTDP-4-dehydrorhamnose reductase [Candidatus Saccharimonadales bacterium]